MQLRREDWVDAFRRAEHGAAKAGLPLRSLQVISLEGARGIFAGANADGLWTLVLVTQSNTQHAPSVNLEYLLAEYGVQYVLAFDGREELVEVSIVQCRTVDPSIRTLFVTFAGELLAALSVHPSVSELSVEVDKWVTLFHR